MRASAVLPPADRLAYLLTAEGIPFRREYKFHSRRKWKADFYIPRHLLIVEVEGGGFIHGRHNQGVGMEDDCEKYAEAMCLGLTVLRVTPRQVDNGKALEWIKRIGELWQEPGE